jgi:phosphoheptose isomerase
MAAELMMRYAANNRPAICLVVVTIQAVTACGNDLGFEALFER